MSLDTRIARARQHARLKDLYADPVKPEFVFSPKTETGTINVLAVKEPLHHNSMLCIHNKHHFTPCLRCGRDAAKTRIFEQMFMRKLSQASAK